MRSLWNDVEARAAVDRWAPACGEAVALRVYTSRLIGVDADLVLHGGGNTSVKDSHTTLLGDRLTVVGKELAHRRTVAHLENAPQARLLSEPNGEPLVGSRGRRVRRPTR